MEPVRFEIQPFANDPGAWSASLVNNAEFVIGALDASQAKSVGEVGAYAGDLTRLLLDWAGETGARVVAIDPSPQPELEQLEAERPELDLVRQTSIEAFQTMELPEAMILDGDHNYYTVARELRLLAERAGDELPLLLLHDVGWPHGRRDDYFDPERIPQEYRQPIAPEAGLYPGVEGTREGGLPYHWPAAREGGPRNGVLTAIEDFVGERDDLRLAVVPAFFGLGVLWRLAAPYADELAELFDPWDRNPILERLQRTFPRLEPFLRAGQADLERAHVGGRKQDLARHEGLRAGVEDYLAEARRRDLRLGIASSDEFEWVAGHLDMRNAIVVVNKTDRPDARCAEVVDESLELLLERLRPHAELAEHRRHHALTLLEQREEQVLRLEGLVTALVGQRLRRLQGLLCFDRELVESHRLSLTPACTRVVNRSGAP